MLIKRERKSASSESTERNAKSNAKKSLSGSKDKSQQKKLTFDRAAIGRIPRGSIVAVDTEGTGLNPSLGARCFAVSMCDENGETGYFRWQVEPKTRAVKYVRRDIEMLAEWFSERSVVKPFHNALYDFRTLAKANILLQEIRGLRDIEWFEETFFAASLCNSEEISRELKPLARKYVKIPIDDERELKLSTQRARRGYKAQGIRIGEHWKEDYWMADPDLCAEYAIKDAERTIMLWLAVYSEWLKERGEGTQEAYKREKSLLYVMWDLIERGVRVDKEMLHTKSVFFSAEANKHKAEIFKYAREEFEISKPNELRRVLFDPKGALRLPIKGCTAKTKAPAVDWKTLQTIEHPIIEHIAEYESNLKAAKSMIQYDSLAVIGPDFTGEEWFIHPVLKQIEAKTGRTSCAEPNLQNVANPETALNKHTKPAREPYGPRRGYVWYSFDLNKQEARGFASLAERGLPLEEQQLSNMLRAGIDPYAGCANLAWGYDIGRWIREFSLPGKKAARRLMERFDHDVVKCEKELKGGKQIRDRAKSIWLGKLYGMGVATAAKNMRCSEDEAREFIYQLEDAIPIMKIYPLQLKRDALRNGYIETWFGRRIDIDPNFSYRCLNYQVQGTAADQLKIAMIEISEMFELWRHMDGKDFNIVLPVHDEIIIEVLKEHATKPRLRAIRDLMTKDIFPVPTLVDIDRITEKWTEKKTVNL